MRIEILGTAFTIRTDEDPAYLSEVVEHYRSKVAELQKSGTTADPLKLAILAGLLASDEFLKLNGASRRSQVEVGQIADSLIDQLDNVLAGESTRPESPPPEL
jgi:cell division protein ZapA